MTKKKPRVDDSFILFDVVYEDGTRSSRRRVAAADLSQVLRGDAPPEYKDPAQFFANTYPTKGLRNVLQQIEPGMSELAAARLMGMNGLPHCCHPMLSAGKRASPPRGGHPPVRTVPVQLDHPPEAQCDGEQ